MDAKEAREICNNATDGPWVEDVPAYGYTNIVSKGNVLFLSVSLENATFVTFARTALPEALEKVEKLEAEIARLREKEKPKIPLKKDLSHYEEGSLCIHFEHYCPVCKHLVESVYDYCGFCGQAIKNDKERGKMTIRELISALLEVKNLDQEITLMDKDNEIRYDINEVKDKEYGVWLEGEK